MADPRIVVYPDDVGGCGHYRLIWPGQALAHQGADVDVRAVTGPDILWQDVLGANLEVIDRLVVDVIVPDADIVVMQRPLRVDAVSAIRKLQEHGLRVVVDIDDDFASIHPHNISHLAVHPGRSPKRNSRHLMDGCAAADWVTVTTPALAERYGKHGRVTVVPNLVPASYLAISQPHDDELVVGWTGTVQTHPTDLQVTGGAVARACRAEHAGIGVVGTGIAVGRHLGFTRDDVHGTGWLELADYPHAMAAFDVGIVPLDPIAFNRAKSALKLMEFAAVGVPTVASPTPDNARMAKLGVGLLANRPREWERELRHLLTDDDWRAQVADRGRTAMAGHTIEGNAGRWLDAWSNALTTSRRT